MTQKNGGKFAGNGKSRVFFRFTHFDIHFFLVIVAAANNAKIQIIIFNEYSY